MQSSVNPNQKPKKENQIITIEYEKAKRDGHIITIVDSYHNVLGRIHKVYNEASKKCEYVAYDHAGHPYSKGEWLWEVKKDFADNREQLLKEAHQRRIAGKEQDARNTQSREEERATEKQVNKILSKEDERKQELHTQRTGTEPTWQKNKDMKDKDNAENRSDKTNTRAEREQELDDLRSPDDDYGIDMDR